MARAQHSEDFEAAQPAAMDRVLGLSDRRLCGCVLLGLSVEEDEKLLHPRTVIAANSCVVGEPHVEY